MKYEPTKLKNTIMKTLLDRLKEEPRKGLAEYTKTYPLLGSLLAAALDKIHYVGEISIQDAEPLLDATRGNRDDYRSTDIWELFEIMD